MRKLLVIVLAAAAISLVITGVALGKGSDQGQRPFVTRTVLTKTIDPNLDGDVVMRPTLGEFSYAYHYARLATNLASVNDPPLVELYFQPDANVDLMVPPNSILASTNPSGKNVWPGANVLLVRNGEILVLFKFGNSSPTSTSLFYTVPFAPGGQIHVTAVVLK